MDQKIIPNLTAKKILLSNNKRQKKRGINLEVGQRSKQYRRTPIF